MNPTNNDKGFLKIVENNEINNESCKKNSSGLPLSHSSLNKFSVTNLKF